MGDVCCWCCCSNLMAAIGAVGRLIVVGPTPLGLRPTIPPPALRGDGVTGEDIRGGGGRQDFKDCREDRLLSAGGEKKDFKHH